MTLQEIFDTVVKGLAGQGFQKSVQDGTCLYRGPNGLKCAAGHLITDEEFAALESADPEINQKKISVYHLWPFFVEKFGKHNIDPISRLQCIHDDSGSPSDMKDGLRVFALNETLNTDVLDTAIQEANPPCA